MVFALCPIAPLMTARSNLCMGCDYWLTVLSLMEFTNMSEKELQHFLVFLTSIVLSPTANPACEGLPFYYNI